MQIQRKMMPLCRVDADRMAFLCNFLPGAHFDLYTESHGSSKCISKVLRENYQSSQCLLPRHAAAINTAPVLGRLARAHCN